MERVGYLTGDFVHDIKTRQTRLHYVLERVNELPVAARNVNSAWYDGVDMVIRRQGYRI